MAATQLPQKASNTAFSHVNATKTIQERFQERYGLALSKMPRPMH